MFIYIIYFTPHTLGVGQSMPRKQSFEALKRKLSLSHDYQPLRQEVQCAHLQK